MRQTGATKIAYLAALTALTAGMAGCLDSQTSLSVRPDGSGTLTERVRVTALASAYASSALDDRAAATNYLEHCRERASRLGAGVRVASVKDIGARDWIGFEALYMVPRIADLQMPQQPDTYLLGGLAPSNTPPGEPLTFGFARGDPSVVTVNVPRPIAASTARLRPAMAAASSRRLSVEYLSAVRKLFEGFRVRMSVQVDGRITRVENGQADMLQPNSVTLFDFDGTKLLADNDHLRRVVSLAPIEDVDSAKVLLDGMPGATFLNEERLTIRFR